MTDDAALLSRLGAALAVAPDPAPDGAAIDALVSAVRAKRVERTQALQQEARDERRRVLRGGPVRRYAAIAAAVAVSPVAACATTAVAGVEPPAPLRPIAELLGIDALPASPDPSVVDPYPSQALGAPAAAGSPVQGDGTVPPGATTAPVAVPATPGAPPVERPHTTLPFPTGPGSDAVPNLTPELPVPPTTPPADADPGTEPAPDPGTDPDPAPAPTPGNLPPTPGGGGPGANRGG